MELQTILDDLAGAVPKAIGAVLCDFEGETVVASLGAARAPEQAEALAREHVPRSMALAMPVQEFLVRLAGAEPCALLRMFSLLGDKHGTGALSTFELRYDEVDVLVDRLPNDFYLVLLLRRPAVIGHARHHLRRAGRALGPHVE